MHITQSMQSYMRDLKSLAKLPSFSYFDKKDENFEKIYNKAQKQNLDLTNAKEILASLSSRELETLRAYKSLADPIKPKQLSQEGAYNLLVHNYENLDYNGDGYVEIGKGKSVPLIPQEVPHVFREKFIASLKEMKKNGASDTETTMAAIAVFGAYSLMKNEKLRYEQDAGFRELLQKHGIDRYMLQIPSFDDDYILRLKYELEHPKAGEYRSNEFIEAMRKFFTAFERVADAKSKAAIPSLESMAFNYRLQNSASNPDKA